MKIQYYRIASKPLRGRFVNRHSPLEATAFPSIEPISTSCHLALASSLTAKPAVPTTRSC
jgi:hypothetical protein